MKRMPARLMFIRLASSFVLRFQSGAPLRCALGLIGCSQGAEMRGFLRKLCSLALFAAIFVISVGARADEDPLDLSPHFRPPAQFANDLGAYRSPLLFDDGRPVRM